VIYRVRNSPAGIVQTDASAPIFAPTPMHRDIMAEMQMVSTVALFLVSCPFGLREPQASGES